MYCDVCNKKTKEIYVVEFPTGRHMAICEECLPVLRNIGIEPWIMKRVEAGQLESISKNTPDAETGRSAETAYPNIYRPRRCSHRPGSGERVNSKSMRRDRAYMLRI